MSADYASRLSKYDNKGVCGLPEEFDPPDKLEEKVTLLSEMMSSAKHTVVHTGAGISTTAGIPDFRGPKGVWTLEERGCKLETTVTFESAVPTLTHRALTRLARDDVVKFVISQNVDGLHLKAGLPRQQLAELHGNMFMERCEKCGKEFVRETAVATVGLKRTGATCLGGGAKGRCRGKLRDTVLDWEDELPKEDLQLSDQHSRKADLSLCLGTTLQILPAGKLPLLAKKRQGKMVVVNLQPTAYDKEADLIIHGYVDDVMERLLLKLKITL